MANRFGNQFRNSIDKALWDIYAVVAIGATGACTLKFWNPSTAAYTNAATSGAAQGAEGVRSISRTSAGLYVITLQDSWRRLLDVDCMIFNASGIPQSSTTASTAGGLVMGVLSGTSDTNVASATAPIITVQFSAPTSSSVTTLIAADPTSGDSLRFHFTLQNSSAL